MQIKINTDTEIEVKSKDSAKSHHQKLKRRCRFMGRRKLEMKRIEDKSSRVEGIVSKYQKRSLEGQETTTNRADEDSCHQFRTCKQLLQTADRLAEENNPDELSVNDMTQLEQELDAALVQTRWRKVVISRVRRKKQGETVRADRGMCRWLGTSGTQ
ncbi:hypothetical protein E3N88_30989 [Mikania micrantha]|uniref:MADS-box domain-containing protein n=1 Tax=Mikania micrantha TaxID=192012 RepID=A0A5N6MN58_9ASTR|nr:hypothetical protein E3N88_30989 [Mikania micrantha]